jgi:hypothetical protein
MDDALSTECSLHSDRFDCPDALVHYGPKFHEYGLIIHDGSQSVQRINFCPWCGTKFADSKREDWLRELERLGILDPDEAEIPQQFTTDQWWRDKA